MATVKMTDFASRAALTGAEILWLTQGGSDVRATVDALLNWGKIVTTAAANYTISDEGINVLEVNVGASTVTLPDRATWAGRTIIIRKVSNSAGTITIQVAGGDTITGAALTSVTLTSVDDYFVIVAGSGQWKLQGGSETISNANGVAIKNANGSMIQYDDSVSTTATMTTANTVVGFRSNGADSVTFPDSFVNTDYRIGFTPFQSGANSINRNVKAAGSCTFYFNSVNSSTNAAIFSWSAIGRWY